MADVGVRWTIGDVSPAGFEALRLSLHGALQVFGPSARYAVCVNTIPVDEVRRRTGDVPAAVEWLAASGVPEVLRPFLDTGMSEGVSWKFAPLRLFPDRHEISLDNDCILWQLPPTIARWFDEHPARCLIAADVTTAFGVFTPFTRPDPRNTGIRGMPPGFDIGAALARVLAEHALPLRSELDEQGLQAVAFDLDATACVVPTSEVSICSPFWPHRPVLGSAGAHFVGLNSRALPFDHYDRPGTEWVLENWRRHLPELHRRVGLAVPA